MVVGGIVSDGTKLMPMSAPPSVDPSFVGAERPRLHELLRQRIDRDQELAHPPSAGGRSSRAAQIGSTIVSSRRIRAKAPLHPIRIAVTCLRYASSFLDI